MRAKDRFVEVGRVLRPWGVEGEMRVEVLGDSPATFRGRKRVFIGGRPHPVQRSRPHQGRVILKLQDIETPEAVDALRGALLEIPEAELSPLPADTYYHFQIIGLKVVTSGGEPIGEIVDILSTGSNDVYTVKGERGEVLIPAIADVIRQVDLERGVLIIEPLPGLLDAS